jgi:hypothetical protein
MLSAALLCLIAIFTAFTVGAAPRPSLIGAFAQYLLPAILTVYLLAVLANARAIIELLASFLLANRKQEPSSGKSLAVILGYAIGIVLVFLLVRTTVVFQIIMGALQTAVTLTTAALHMTQTQRPTQPGGLSINPLVYYYTLMIFGTLVVVSLTLVSGGLLTAYNWAREDHMPPKTEAARRDALRVVQRAAMSLRLTGDYREAILKCYRQMCQVLSDHGFNIGLQETASEFSESISHKLELGSDSVRGLTFLFEEARYSNHQIDNAKRVTALSELESLERSLVGAKS